MFLEQLKNKETLLVWISSAAWMGHRHLRRYLAEAAEACLGYFN